jgi:hypothetical protein
MLLRTQVTTLLAGVDAPGAKAADAEAALVRKQVEQQADAVRQAKAAAAAAADGSSGGGSAVEAAVGELKRLKQRLQAAESAAAALSLPVDVSGQIDYRGDFFGEKVFLTVSGQLNGAPRGGSMGARRDCAAASAGPLQGHTHDKCTHTYTCTYTHTRRTCCVTTCAQARCMRPRWATSTPLGRRSARKTQTRAATWPSFG